MLGGMLAVAVAVGPGPGACCCAADPRFGDAVPLGCCAKPRFERDAAVFAGLGIAPAFVGAVPFVAEDAVSTAFKGIAGRARAIAAKFGSGALRGMLTMAGGVDEVDEVELPDPEAEPEEVWAERWAPRIGLELEVSVGGRGAREGRGRGEGTAVSFR